ncbi:MAG: hypothetical protein R3D67_00310 [Hyphomicrobiaceae bacterium]
MHLRALALGLMLALAWSVPADAQRRGGPAASNWELLGEEKVGFGADRDVIKLNHDENFYRNKSYRRLRFIARGGEVKMRSIRLVYLNGHVEDLSFNQTLRPGQDIDIDLKGERSYLRQIEMFYKSKFGIAIGGGGIQIKQASIQVLGENVRGGGRPEPRPEPRRSFDVPRGWSIIGAQRYNRRDDRIEIEVGRRAGRIGQIRLHHEGEPVSVREVHVTFGNGEVQNMRYQAELKDGETTQPINLEGDTRLIKNIIVKFDPKRRPGPVAMSVLGSERPLDAVSQNQRPNWVPLGEASVGFRVDRDVIRIGKNEGWYRNRAFDKLHFVAENSDVHIISIRVVYLNGFAEDYAVDRLVRVGGDIGIDLREAVATSRKSNWCIASGLGSEGGRWFAFTARLLRNGSVVEPSG